jgi:hypothetical protein
MTELAQVAEVEVSAKAKRQRRSAAEKLRIGEHEKVGATPPRVGMRAARRSLLSSRGRLGGVPNDLEFLD